jgi:cytochrome c peroxidase
LELNIARKTAKESSMRIMRLLARATVPVLCLLFFVKVQAAGLAASLPRGLPADLWEILVPPENPVTPEKIALGRALYFDKRLSKDGTVSCATCHDPGKGFSDGRKVAEGIGGKKGARNSPTVLNAVFNEFQFWDGRAPSLEEQAKGPMINPVEMGMESHDAVVKVVRSVPEYQAAFAKVFGREPSIDDVVAAIATFERTVVSGDSAFDRFHAGDPSAMSAAAQRGWELWNGKARCNTCHPFGDATPNFSDNKFHNIGVAAKGRDFAGLARKAAGVSDLQELAFDPDFTELGRFVATKQPKDIGSFKSPGLRDVALTAPYMHDGSEATLLDVVKFYDKGGEPNPYLDGGITPLKLTEQERQDLVSFMEALTGEGAGSPTRAELQDPAKKEAAQ